MPHKHETIHEAIVFLSWRSSNYSTATFIYMRLNQIYGT